MPTSTANPRATQAFWIAFGVCTFLVCLALWTVEYLPLIDLPQHAAQVSMWQRMGTPGTLESRSLELNWFTPYLLAYSLARILAVVVSVHTAFVTLATIAVVALPLSILFAVRHVGGHPWWALPGFALAFNFSFHWGFLNFALGTPIAVVFFVLVLRYVEEPSRKRLAGCLALLCFTLLTHVLIFGLCGLVAAIIMLSEAESLREAAIRAGVLALPLPLVGWWLWSMRATEAMTSTPPVWKLGPERLLHLLEYQLGTEADARPDRLVVAAVLLSYPLLAGGRFTHERRRAIPLVVVLALALFAPHEAMGTTFIAGRYTAFLLPTLVLALDDRAPAADQRRRRLAMAVAPLVTMGWLVTLCVRFWRYDQRTAGFHDVLAALEPNRRLLYFSMYPRDPTLERPVFVHFGQWYAVERGGIADFSFAQNFPALVRYLPEAAPNLPHDFEWRPQLFVAAEHRAEIYQYFLARAPADPTPVLAARVPGRLWLVANERGWWAMAYQPPGAEATDGGGGPAGSHARHRGDAPPGGDR